MLFRLEYDDVHQVWCVTPQGEIGLKEYTDVLAGAWGHPGYAESVTAIWDLDQCQLLIDYDEITELVRWIAKNKRGRGPEKIAFIASRNLEFGTSRVYAALQEMHGYKINIFRTRLAARDWL